MSVVSAYGTKSGLNSESVRLIWLITLTGPSGLPRRVAGTIGADDGQKNLVPKLVLNEKLQNFGQPVHSFSKMFELSLKFTSNPWNIWASGQLSLKRTVLRLAFSERIAYSRKTGLRTPQVSVPFVFFGVSTKNVKWCTRHDSNVRPPDS